MKKIFVIALTFIFALNIFAQKTEYIYHFNQPIVKNVGNYQILVLPESQQNAKLGEPVLPFVAVNLLLPPNSTSKNISYIFEDKIKLEGNYNLYPKQETRPLSLGYSNEFKINKEVYSTNSYPEINHTNVSTQFMNGYGFAMSKFTPFEYNPSTGEVFYYQTVSVIVDYESDSKNHTQNISSRNEVIQRVSDFAQNSEVIKNYPAKKTSSEYDMLIITTSTYSGGFDDLIDFHLQRGIRAKVVTLSQISTIMSGVDIQEKMRNYIIQEYQNNDIQYVLLGGDADVVPYRSLYCEALSGGSAYSDNIPADVYFSALDGSWNNDGDAYWGEPNEDDLLPEIGVGRLPFSNSLELTIIINKIISYTNSPVTSTGELNNPLLAGEDLYYDPQTWGADYLDLIIGYHIDNGYTTDGINTDYTTMYARDNTWNGSGSEIISEMNSGHSFVHHVGHANSDFMMGLYTWDITNSNFSQLDGVTHNYALVYSHGCICGAFDSDDCVSEMMVTIEKCAVGVFTNSRYGWFNEGQTEGPSTHLHREFVDALYTDLENHAGLAEMISKYETAPWVENPDEYEPGAQRWVFYDHNVLTDPALPIWTANPFAILTSYDSDIPLGADISITVTSAKGTLENYTCVLLQNGLFIGKGVTNSSGNATVFVDPSVAQIGDAQLYVSGYNIITQEYPVNIASSESAVLSMSEYSFSDDNNNEPEYNELMSLNVKIDNYGQENASNTVLTLSTQDDNISIIQSTDNIGTVTALDFILSSDVLQFQTDFVDDQYSADLVLDIVSDQYSTTRTIPVVINAPNLTLVSVSVSEASGDGDGVLEANETGNISFEFENNGHAASPSISGDLTTESTDITILNTSSSIGIVDAGGTFSISSDFLIGENVEEGDVISVFCEVDAGYYSQNATVGVFIGSIVEDFETGDFTKFEWEFAGDVPWEITSTVVQQGSYSAVSGDIGDSEISSLIIDIEVMQDGEISFYKKVSSEDGWDYLKFYIDGVQKNMWSGEVEWSQETYNISSGNHTLKWSYEKDSNTSSGSDCAWLDYVEFPAFGSIIISTEEIVENNISSLNVYPIPFTSEVNFAFNTEKQENVKLEIYDVSGKLIWTKDIISSKGENKIIWTPENIGSGLFLYRIKFGNEMYSGKLIK
ncbi:MAG: T9SS type A sorting domain-containing protein [Bacteroidales bacterium]|nr:T9SS type A sorting domain-containing protein [Bacteroidales bacterium]